MTDKPKTIQEALAQVQRNISEGPNDDDQIRNYVQTKVKPAVVDAGRKVKNFVSHSLGMDKTPEQSAASLQKAGEKISGAVTTAKNAVTGGSTPAPTTGAATGGFTTPPAAKTASAPAPTPKPETPPAGSSAAKMSFADAYNKARQMAKAAGKDPNTAQFKFDRGGGEKVYQSAETKKDYVSVGKQFKVDINAPSTTKNPAGPPSPNPVVDAPKPPRRPPESTAPEQGGTSVGGPANPNDVEKVTGKNKKNIDEAPLMGSASDFVNFKKYNQNATYGQYLNSIRGLTAKKGGANDPNVIQGKMNSSAMKTSGGPVTTGKAWDPDKIGTPSPRPKVNTAPSGGSTANINPPGRTSSTSPPVLQNRGGDPKTSAGGTTQSGVRGVGSDSGNVARSSSNDSWTSKDRTIDSEVKGGDPTPSGASDVMTSSGNPNKKTSNTASTTTGTTTEMTNPLIAAFLQLQEKNPSNMFEAAKKAKKDHDGDGKIESGKDEYFGSREAAAKKAGKMEEEQIDEIKVSTADSYLSKRTEQARKGLLPGDRNPTSKTELKNMTNAANRTDKDYYKKRGFKKVGEETEIDEELKGSQHKIDANKNNKIDAHDFKLLRSKKKMKEDAEETKLPKDWGEGVEFSEEELAFFASVEETFTPTEPGRVNKDQAGHTDLNDEVTEAKKKVEEPSTERDARQHIQVVAGQAAAGREIDFPHNNGKSTKINPQMGRKITAHLNSLKPAERQAKVKAMHDSPEGMKF